MRNLTMYEEIENQIGICDGYRKDIIREFGSDFKEVDTIRKMIEKIKKTAKEDRPLKIVFAGQMNTSKSLTADNLLFNGAGILASSPTPSTAKVTRIRYSETESAEVTYLDQFDIDDLAESAESELYMTIEKAAEFPKEKIGATDSIPMSSLRQYSDVGGQYTPYVKEINIGLKRDILKNLTCVDVPGINDPVVSRDIIAKEEMKDADVVFYLSAAGSFMDTLDIDEYLDLKQYWVSDIVVLAAKFDECLENADYTEHDLSTSLKFEKIKFDFLKNLKNKCNEKVLNYEDYRPSAILPICSMAAKIKNNIDILDDNDKLIANKALLEAKMKIDFNSNWVYKLSGITALDNQLEIIRQNKDEIQKKILIDSLAHCYIMLFQLLEERQSSIKNKIEECDLFLNNPDKYTSYVNTFAVFASKSNKALAKEGSKLDEYISDRCDKLIKHMKAYEEDAKKGIKKASNRKDAIKKYAVFTKHINDLLDKEVKDIFKLRNKKLFKDAADELKNKLTDTQKKHIHLNDKKIDGMLSDSIDEICIRFEGIFRKLFMEMFEDVMSDMEKNLKESLKKPNEIRSAARKIDEKDKKKIKKKAEKKAVQKASNEVPLDAPGSESYDKAYNKTYNKTYDQKKKEAMLKNISDETEEIISNVVSSAKKTIKTLRDIKVQGMLEKLNDDIDEKIAKKLNNLSSQYQNKKTTDVFSKKTVLTHKLQNLDGILKNIQASSVAFKQTTFDE